MIISEIHELLCCPDDAGSLKVSINSLECSVCTRKYTLIADNLLEVMPSAFPEWDLRADEPQVAGQMYLEEFRKPFTWTTTGGWGNLTNASPGIKAFYNKEMETSLSLLHPSKDGIAIDVSGAVGNYAVLLSDKVKVIVNCDLHVPSLVTAYNRKKSNMVCIRCPYLQLPFVSNSFDYAICTDTLIRGNNHEVKLLKEILRILKKGGKAFVDFHNIKWFKKNNQICSYSVDMIVSLLSAAGIKIYSIYSFGYVLTKLIPCESLYPLLNKIFMPFFPPTRHIVLFAKS